MATRILIADDHELMRVTLRNLINSHEGWQVCAEAKDGREAVAQAQKLQPDLIVLDLAMPVMDGVQAAREIIKSRPEARVIMFTLHASEEVEKHAKRAGVREVVSKAKNGGRLVTTMEQLLVSGGEKGSLRDEARHSASEETQSVHTTNGRVSSGDIADDSEKTESQPTPPLTAGPADVEAQTSSSSEPSGSDGPVDT